MLKFKTKKLLVMSLIQCHFAYECSFWYPGLTQFLCKKLQITQNKVIRFVLNLDPRSHLGPDDFRSFGWLLVSKRVHQIDLNQGHPLTILFLQVLFMRMEPD